MSRGAVIRDGPPDVWPENSTSTRYFVGPEDLIAFPELYPAEILFEAIALNPVPGVVNTNLTAAVLVFSAVALDPDPGVVNTNLTTAVLVFSAVALDPEPSPAVVNLTPAILVFSAIALDPDPGAVTTNLTTAVLNFSARVLDPDPGLVTTSLVPGVLNFSSIALDPDPGVVSINLTPAVLSFSSIPLNPVGTGSASTNLTPAVLNFSSIPLNPTGGGAASANLTPAVLNFSAIPLNPDAGMVISVTVYGPPPMPAQPCSWDVNVTCCASFWDTLDPDVQTLAAEYGAFTLWAATGRRFGLCERTVRPCGKQGPMNPAGYFWSEGSWRPYLFNGSWRNCGGCGGGFGCCTCEPTCQVWLPPPAYSIPVTGVSEDGVIIGSDLYRIDNGQWLVRTDGECWTECQNYDVDSGMGTFAVTYLQGIPVPRVLLGAAGEYACEWARACIGQDCRLPTRAQSISRQGITISNVSIEDLLNNGLTGIPSVDNVIVQFNPYGLKSRMRVVSPDTPIVRTTTFG
jgi:hypothetical protein